VNPSQRRPADCTSATRHCRGAEVSHAIAWPNLRFVVVMKLSDHFLACWGFGWIIRNR
jgi:hypothetical protein